MAPSRPPLARGGRGAAAVGALEAAGWRAGRRRGVGGMGLLEQCEAAFGSADLYCVLGVRREASPEEIRRGYRRASLRVHPDRVEPAAKEEATRRFQVSAGGWRRALTD